jgi:tetratricopeptide (TPR) repeat protein
VAGNQFATVERGDHLWVMTLNEDRELFLAGHLLVGEVVEYEEATRRMPNAGLWQAEYYAFPEEGTEEFLHPIPLAGVAGELRFKDENADRLLVMNGQVNPAQLRTIRELTEGAARLITDMWERRELPIDEMTPEERLEFFFEFVEENPDEPAAHYNLGVVLNENGLDEEAVQAYREAVRLDAGYMPAHFNLGATLKRLGRDDEAIEAFNGAVLANHEYAPAHFMLGSVYLDSGQFKRAIEATETGLRYAPDDAGAYHNIALAYYHLGDFRSALRSFDRALALEPDDAFTFFRKGVCHRELGEVDEEIGAYRAALDRSPDFFPDCMLALGAAWAIKHGASREAIRYIETGGVMELNDSEHLFYLSLAYLALGMGDVAREQVEFLRKIDSNLAARLEEYATITADQNDFDNDRART